MKAANQNTPFPRKLFELIETEPNSLIEWSDHGACFFIRDVDEFCAVVLPKYFRHTKLTSFQRQLNLYGFRRITKGPDSGGYYHPTFLRHQPNAIDSIKRMVRKGERDIAPTPPYVYPKSSRANNRGDEDEDESLSSPYKHRYTTTSSRRARARGGASTQTTARKQDKFTDLDLDSGEKTAYAGFDQSGIALNMSRTGVRSSNTGGSKSKATGARKVGTTKGSVIIKKDTSNRGPLQPHRKRKLKHHSQQPPSKEDYGISPTSPFSFPDVTHKAPSPSESKRSSGQGDLDDQSFETEPNSSNRSLAHTEEEDEDEVDFVQEPRLGPSTEGGPTPLSAPFAGHSSLQFHWRPSDASIAHPPRALPIPSLDRAHSSVSTDESWASQQSRSAPATSVLFMNQHIPESPRMLSPRHTHGFDGNSASYTFGLSYFGGHDSSASTAPVEIPHHKASFGSIHSGQTDLWASDDLVTAPKLVREHSHDWQHFGGETGTDPAWSLSDFDPIDTFLDMDFPMDDMDVNSNPV